LRVERVDGTSVLIWWNILSSLAWRLKNCNKHSPAPTSVARERLVTTVLNKPEEGFLGEFFVRDKLVRIYQGDITNLVADVIVSSDDTYLKMNGGVSYRIRVVGGEDIYRETRNLIPSSLGSVEVTNAGKLQAKKIFHGVVIDWRNEILPSHTVIQQVVHNCLEKASQYRFKSIAFPLLGTGSGGFPVKVAWEITLRQIIRDLTDENQNLVEVILVLYGRQIVEELNIKAVLEKIKKLGWRVLL
jgi:O-acetyl-ADP-ribose deacetylase (regulator of RNase III)